MTGWPAWSAPSCCSWSSENPDKDIAIYVNSPGGQVHSGLAMYDTMQYIRCEISTVCIGMAASMGSLMLAAGAKGKRFALPNSKIMVHQPSGGFQGQASDIEIHAREVLKTRAQLNAIYAKHTGQDLKVIEDAMDRDNFMDAEQAKAFGIIDEVVGRAQPVPARRPAAPWPRPDRPGATRSKLWAPICWRADPRRDQAPATTGSARLRIQSCAGFEDLP